MLGRRVTGDRIMLIPHLPEHVATLYEWYDFTDLYPPSQLMGWKPYLQNYEYVARDPSYVMWCVVKRDDEAQLIGRTDLRQCRREQDTRDSYIWLLPEHRNQGYGTEAIRLRAQYAFERLSVDTMQTSIPSTREPIRHVLGSVGYQAAGKILALGRECEMLILCRQRWQRVQAVREMDSNART